jgi:hypothetical protein
MRYVGTPTPERGPDCLSRFRRLGHSLQTNDGIGVPLKLPNGSVGRRLRHVGVRALKTPSQTVLLVARCRHPRSNILATTFVSAIVVEIDRWLT